ncbi:hypothetical protein [Nocardia cyriacigeorgica]|uniref:hypothetical protein n=1 Tax=Nocardia cyriacigeorgica TaxID=135487 RepID=UPI001486CDA7|nr:hypothetical protein [Nocardia cyriacigeorgica]
MNDQAALSSGVLSGFGAMEPQAGLAEGLREQAARGIVRRGEVLTWSDSTADADGS